MNCDSKGLAMNSLGRDGSSQDLCRGPCLRCSPPPPHSLVLGCRDAQDHQGPPPTVVRHFLNCIQWLLGDHAVPLHVP